MPRRDRDRLLDVLEAIEAIEQYAAPGLEDRGSRDPLWDAVSFNLMIVGEALSHVSDEVRAREPGIDWRGAIGMRNAIAHEYFAARRDLILEAVQRDVPLLRAAVERLLRDLPDD